MFDDNLSSLPGLFGVAAGFPSPSYDSQFSTSPSPPIPQYPLTSPYGRNLPVPLLPPLGDPSFQGQGGPFSCERGASNYIPRTIDTPTFTSLDSDASFCGETCGFKIRGSLSSREDVIDVVHRWDLLGYSHRDSMGIYFHLFVISRSGDRWRIQMRISCGVVECRTQL